MENYVSNLGAKASKGHISRTPAQNPVSWSHSPSRDAGSRAPRNQEEEEEDLVNGTLSLP